MGTLTDFRCRPEGRDGWCGTFGTRAVLAERFERGSRCAECFLEKQTRLRRPSARSGRLRPRALTGGCKRAADSRFPLQASSRQKSPQVLQNTRQIFFANRSCHFSQKRTMKSDTHARRETHRRANSRLPAPSLPVSLLPRSLPSCFLLATPDSPSAIGGRFSCSLLATPDSLSAIGGRFSCSLLATP